MSNGDDKNKKPQQKPDDSSAYIERRDRGRATTDAEIITEKLQRPAPWPDPPSEDQD